MNKIVELASSPTATFRLTYDPIHKQIIYRPISRGIRGASSMNSPSSNDSFDMRLQEGIGMVTTQLMHL